MSTNNDPKRVRTAPHMPERPVPLGVCPVCHQLATGTREETEALPSCPDGVQVRSVPGGRRVYVTPCGCWVRSSQLVEEMPPPPGLRETRLEIEPW